MVQNDINCSGGSGFKNGAYHVHHDFMPPTVTSNCTWNKNINLTEHKTDLRKENPNDWVHSLTHKPGTACLVPGPQSADWLLRVGGELDGASSNGAGARSLATGGPPINTTTCFGTSWCGTLTVTQPVLLAAYTYWLDTYGIQPSSNYTYGPDAAGHYVWVEFYGYVYPCYGCPPSYGLYWVHVYAPGMDGNIVEPDGTSKCGFASGSFTRGEFVCGPGLAPFQGVREGFYFEWVPKVSPPPAITGYQTQWPTSVGGNPTQEQANQWVRDQIDQGHWNDGAKSVKSTLDGVIRPAANRGKMQSLGITESPSFEGWVVLCRAGVGCY